MSTVRVVTIRNGIHGALQLQLKTRFWSTGNKRGIHRAESFFICKCSCKMLWTRSIEMFTMLESLRTFTRRSFNTLSFFGWFPHSWRFSGDPNIIKDERPHLNSAAHFFTVENDGEESPKVESSSFFISVTVNPFKMNILWLRDIQFYPFLKKYQTLSVLLEHSKQTSERICLKLCGTLSEGLNLRKIIAIWYF